MSLHDCRPRSHAFSQSTRTGEVAISTFSRYNCTRQLAVEEARGCLVVQPAGNGPETNYFFFLPVNRSLQESTNRSFMQVVVLFVTAPTALIGADALKSGITSDSLPSDQIGDSCSSQGLSKTIDQNASSEVGCCCPCCTNFDIAHQPTKLEQSKVKGHQLYSRSIQLTWYTKYQWISVCYKVFCSICCSARKRGLVKSSKRYYRAFFEEGTGKSHYSVLLNMKKVKCTESL